MGAKLLRRGARLRVGLRDGVVLVGSDGHYWPGPPTTAHRAFVKFCRDLRPALIVFNGDVMDGATVSRHLPIGWEKNPEVYAELKICQQRLKEIERAAPGALRIWTLGNHDMRFETFLAQAVPQYKNVPGIHLKDHFPGWLPAWSCEINGRGSRGGGGVILKHRFRGGVHAARSNALASGRTIVTAHRHALQVTPVSDYDGTRWGVDCGMLGEPYGPQFIGYTEDSPVDWRAGFIVLTFKRGRLLWPEPVAVVDQKHVSFRGELFRV